MMMNGKIDISRYTSNVPPYSGVSIRIRDELSGVEFLSITMTVAEFAEAVMGLGHRSMTFELRKQAVAVIGMKREHKVVPIKMPPGTYTLRPEKPEHRKLMAQLLKPYEVDGWQGCDADFSNGHNFWREVGAKYYLCNVGFTRYVKVP
jgi:hypothetical protein